MYKVYGSDIVAYYTLLGVYINTEHTFIAMPAYTAVACVVCSTTVLLSDVNYGHIVVDIHKGIKSDIMFRCTVCISCENKIPPSKFSLFSVPAPGCRFPIGANIILSWSPYKNVSMYMRRYCRLYSCKDTDLHVTENRMDILNSLDDGFYIYEFSYDDMMHLEPTNVFEFFMNCEDNKAKRPRYN